MAKAGFLFIKALFLNSGFLKKAVKRLALGKDKKVVKKPKGPKPDLSIIVIALNEEKIIANCLKSLREQDFKGRIEIILADGCSEDNTVRIAKPLVDGLILEKNRNCAFERNAGSLLARADIIAFCDSDSFVPKNWASQLMQSFENDREIIGVFGTSGFYDTGKFEKALSLFAMGLYSRAAFLFGAFTPANSNYAFKKKFWENADGMDTNLKTCEDHEFFSRISKLGKIAFNPKMIVYTSARRVKKMGYVRFLKFQLSNMRQFYKTGKASQSYEDIR